MDIGENFAERLFCDLRNSDIKIAKPSYCVDGHKTTDFPNMSQFNIIGNSTSLYSFNAGVAWKNDSGEAFTQAYQKLFHSVKCIGSKIRFYSLVVPRSLKPDAKLEEFESVVSRYLRDYLPMTDIEVSRWDVLVGPA